MRPFTRLPIPDFLLKNWEKWSSQYAKKKEANSNFSFQWATYKGKKVNQTLLPNLIEQTQQHCSYCDHYPPKISDDTIDHFKPKGNSRFYRIVYLWENLYYCCGDCQRYKFEQFDELLLRPDEDGFSFERYFLLDTKTFEIKPNLAAIEFDQKRAEITIRIFGFNENGNPTSRRHSWQRFYGLNENDRIIVDFPYRFMFA